MDDQVPEVLNVKPGATITTKKINFSALIDTFDQEAKTTHIYINNKKYDISSKKYLKKEDSRNRYQFDKKYTLVEGLNNFSYKIITELGNTQETKIYYVTVDTTGPEAEVNVE